MREFNQQLYLSASFFKMKSTGSPAVDEKINGSVGELQAFPHPAVTAQVIPSREPWTKQKQKNIVRGEQADMMNKANDANSKREAAAAKLAALSITPKVVQMVQAGYISLANAEILDKFVILEEQEWHLEEAKILLPEAFQSFILKGY